MLKIVNPKTWSQKFTLMMVKNSCITNVLENNFNLTFCTLNVKGQQKELKRKKQYSWARDGGMDVLFLQETHSQLESENIWRNQWAGENSYFCHGESNSRGVSTHFRNGIGAKILEVCTDPSGRFLWIKTEIKKQVWGLMNIYAPNGEKEQITFYKNVREFLRKKKQKQINIIIGGDFNVVRNHKDKQGGQRKCRSKVVELIDNIIDEFSLTDIWRAKNPWSRQYTWSQNSPRVTCRLDMWLIPSQFVQLTKFATITNAVGTDHKAVTFNLEGEKYVPRGPGLWKLNTSVLKEVKYQEMITKTIQEIKDSTLR